MGTKLLLLDSLLQEFQTNTMASLLVKNRALFQQCGGAVTLSSRGYGGGHHSALPIPLTKVDIGKREIVGFGGNGEATYIDSVMNPFPAIRFKEDVEIAALRVKEQGDWKKMTKEEKKALYRASFCQTLAEVEAPTGEWKSISGIVLVGISLGVWIYLWMATFVYPEMPDTFNDDKLKAQIDRMIAIRNGPISGIASEYDYEKGQWKK